MISVTVKGAQAAARNHRKVDQAFPQIARKHIHRAGLHFQGQFVKNRLSAPTTLDSVSRRTGRWASSMATVVRPHRGLFRAIVGTKVFYAAVHEHGATIRPVRARVLAWRSGGRWHAAHQVKLPRRRLMAKERAAQEGAIQRILGAIGLEMAKVGNGDAPNG